MFQKPKTEKRLTPKALQPILVNALANLIF